MSERTFYYTSDDDCFPYFGRSADKSAAAKHREEKAMEMFSKAKIQTETRQDLIPGSCETIKLLKPSCHLTGPCWSSFSKHVRSHPGWTVKRRAITDEEKKLWGETRKGKCYFVDGPTLFQSQRSVLLSKTVLDQPNKQSHLIL